MDFSKVGESGIPRTTKTEERENDNLLY